MTGSLRIFYFPHTPNNDGPADRRRFTRWSSVRNHELIRDKNQKSDLAVLTPKGLFMAQYFHSQGIPVILDTVDAQNMIANWSWDLILGISTKRMSGFKQITPLRLSSMVKNNLKFVHTVVVANPEQEYLYNSYTNTTHILDSHFEIPFLKINEARSMGEIVWEGLPYTWNELFPVVSKIKRNAGFNDVKLNIVSSDKFKSLYNPFGLSVTKRRLSFYKVLYNLQIDFHSWSANKLVEVAEQSGIGFLPLANKKENMLKAENRLLIMWKLGLPVLFSDTVAYSRIAQESGATGGLCKKPQDWIDRFTEWRESPSRAIREVELGQSYIRKEISEEKFLVKWDNLVFSCMNKI